MIALEDWPRALGLPPVCAVIRSQPEDFEVSEELGFEPDGDGEHCLLSVRKRALNTQDVARQLAQLAGVPERDVGYCGMKDRNAVTRQWFSVGLAGRSEPDWSSLDGPDLQVCEQARHRRKLRRGVHRRNHFRLRLRGLQGDVDALSDRLVAVSAQGVPNYFGEQRFGRNAANLERARAWFCGEARRPRRHQQGLYLSAARSFLFNRLLAVRVGRGCWQAPAVGDVCMLAGSRSFFTLGESDGDIDERVRQGDVQLALPLWGKGGQAAGGLVCQQQSASLAPYSSLCEGLVAAGAKLQYRPSRQLPDDFCWQFCDDGELLLSFALERGSYATAVLRELVQYRDQSGDRSEFSSEQP